MTEAARKVAEETEQRLDDLAESVQNRFDRITKGRLSDQSQADRSVDRGGRVGHGAGQVRSDQHRRERGGSR
ncbi:hypothetical protein [Micromonospora sp. C95]|uniref:hypothetical protein n=1 Tax=Micromonospora sp. C95 TaxID=2824882 RepID=UPI001B35C419|nr:hypothetical protein [Micromonospora sp. C95]MBQ1023204.1 hypothetical protein [Micromonospora sp. C95]